MGYFIFSHFLFQYKQKYKFLTFFLTPESSGGFAN